MNVTWSLVSYYVVEDRTVFRNVGDDNRQLYHTYAPTTDRRIKPDILLSHTTSLDLRTGLCDVDDLLYFLFKKTRYQFR